MSLNTLSWSDDQQNDPAYELYKTGYNLILEERWKDAQNRFAELVTRYPKSEYVDEAHYWTAYALSNSGALAVWQFTSGGEWGVIMLMMACMLGAGAFFALALMLVLLQALTLRPEGAAR